MQKDRYSEDRIIEIKGETKTLTVKDNVTVQETLSASKVEASDASKTSTFAGGVNVGGALSANSIQTDSGIAAGGNASFGGSQSCNYIVTNSSSYSVASDDYFIVCTADSATVTLPSSPSLGRVFIIKNNTDTSITIGSGHIQNNIFSGTSTTPASSYTLPEHKSIMLIATTGQGGMLTLRSYWIVSYL